MTYLLEMQDTEHTRDLALSAPDGVGLRIREARRARGWTQDDLAQAIGVSRSAVAQWETDRTGQVRTNLGRIAHLLGLSIEHLLHGASREPAKAVGGDELALLRLYRACQPDDRAMLLRTAHRLARDANASQEVLPAVASPRASS